MGTRDRKLLLTVMVAGGTIAVLGLATGNGVVALLGTFGVAVLALVLIWGGGTDTEVYRGAPIIASGPRKHGGCLTWFMLVWIALEVFGLVSLIIGPTPDDFVNWSALGRDGDLQVILHVFLLGVLPSIRIGCLIAVWAWWKKWGVVGFLSAAGVDLVIEAVGRAWLGPPPISATSPHADLGAAAFVTSVVIYFVFVVLVWRERVLFD